MAHRTPALRVGHRLPTAFTFLLSLLVVAPVLAQDESKIWEGLFNYQQKMANIGNAEAQYKLAGMYAQGQGVKADPGQARHWYEASAAQGYTPAQRKLAALAAGGPMVKLIAPTPAPDSAVPAAAAVLLPVEPSAELAPPAVPRQEFERMEFERKRLEQELARSREAMRKLQEEQARQAAALHKAESEKDEARRRLAAKELLEAEMKKLRETPPTFDQ
jgi:TPR repeat protein